jgi:hypothetical protein
MRPERVPSHHALSREEPHRARASGGAHHRAWNFPSAPSVPGSGPSPRGTARSSSRPSSPLTPRASSPISWARISRRSS